MLYTYCISKLFDKPLWIRSEDAQKIPAKEFMVFKKKSAN